jgi:hypothetical protein
MFDESLWYFTENESDEGYDIMLLQDSASPDFRRGVAVNDIIMTEVMDDEPRFEARRSLIPSIDLLNQLFVTPGELILDVLKKLCYIGPIREVPPRGYEYKKLSHESQWASGLAAWDALNEVEIEDDFEYDDGVRYVLSMQKLAKQVSETLSSPDKLNMGYKISIRQIKELDVDSILYQNLMQLRNNIDLVSKDYLEVNILDLIRKLPSKTRIQISTDEGFEVSPQDIGVGISQIIPVVVAAYMPQSHFNIIAVEQPELHVHPAIQCNLGDIFIEQINQFENRIFLLETHSEHLLLRLLKRIRETSSNQLPPGKSPLTPEDLAIIYIENNGDGLKLTSIPIDADGEFTEDWPKGFFEERLNELI